RRLYGIPTARGVLGEALPTLDAVLEALHARYPGIRDRLCEPDGTLREYIHVFVDACDLGRDPAAIEVPDGAEVTVVPSIAGGGVAVDEALRARIDAELPQTIEDLRRLVRIPSVAAQRQGIPDTVRAVGDLLRGAGGRVTVLEHAGANPVVVGEFEGRSPRTLLFYDHYDVQPAEPLDEWTVPPFDVTQRDEKLFGRGVADNKGDLMTRIAAIRSLRAVRGGLPCRVKFLIEGEEEISSPHLGAITRAHTDLLKADACIWEYGERDSRERKHIVCGMKGICYLQLEAKTAAVDLHSSLGAVFEGAAFRLVWALSTFKDQNGRVQIPGHYDRVRRPTPAEEEVIRQIPPDVVEDVQKQVGVARTIGGVGGPEAVRQLLLTPTCTICGIWGGYTLEGSKTVLPKVARAKVDFRLVPDQDPHEVAQNVRRHLDAGGFGDIEVTVLGAEHPWRTNLADPFVGLVRDCVKEATGREVLVYPTSAGTGPAHDVGPVLGIPLVSAGSGYWNARAHAPDENVRASDFRETILLMAHILERFGRIS
ncbi:MAG TPA: M20/M25/M40 family metallo-hydrolase, partial [bacterium]|nr:M20/M25/M40 family metallo-hydrolase [bacterium]